MRTPNFIVPTNFQSRILYFSVQASQPCILNVIADDAQDATTRYLDFDMELRQGVNLVNVPMPVTPKNLAVYIQLKSPAEVYLLQNSVAFSDRPKTSPLNLPKEVQEYVDAALEFSKRASHEPLGVFYTRQDADGSSIAIWEYKQYIPMKDGQGREYEATTPAATFVDTGNMWVSKNYMMRMTVPIRFFTLLHEHAHHILGLASNPNDPSIEQRCDIWARNIFFSMGFTDKDLQKLIGQALTDTATNQARMNAIYNTPPPPQARW